MILEHVLVLSAYLFSIGIYGLITSRNMVRAFMCLELILNAVNLFIRNILKGKEKHLPWQRHTHFSHGGQAKKTHSKSYQGREGSQLRKSLLRVSGEERSPGILISFHSSGSTSNQWRKLKNPWFPGRTLFRPSCFGTGKKKRFFAQLAHSAGPTCISYLAEEARHPIRCVTHSGDLPKNRNRVKRK